MRAYDVAFVGALCYRFPVLMGLLQGHLDDYDGLLPHVLMGDVTRWVTERFVADGSDPTVIEMLDFIEDAFGATGGEDRELIAASFLENLPQTGQPGEQIRALLGPTLREQLNQMG